MAETKGNQHLHDDANIEKAKQWGYDVNDDKSMSKFYETEKLIEKALKKAPWNMMNAHLHSNKARREYQSICHQIRRCFDGAHAFSRTHEPYNPLLARFDNAYYRAASKETLTQPKLSMKGQLMKNMILVLSCCAVGFYGGTFLRRPGGGEQSRESD